MIFKGKHVAWNCRYHLVFVTKFRKPLINPEVWLKIKTSLLKVASRFDAKIEESNWERDHVHMLISLPPKHSISRAVNSLKGVSSRMSGQKRLWSPSYYVGTCGNASLSTVKRYIEQQRNSSSA